MPTISLDDSPFAGGISTPPTNRSEPTDWLTRERTMGPR
jgi:hypothetical protein